MIAGPLRSVDLCRQNKLKKRHHDSTPTIFYSKILVTSHWKKRIFFKCQDLSFPYDFLNGRGEKVPLQATSRLQLLFPPLPAVRLSGVLGVEAWRLYPSVVLRASYDIKKNEGKARSEQILERRMGLFLFIHVPICVLILYYERI